MSAYKGQFLTDHMPPLPPPALPTNPGLADIAKFLNDAADALDPGLLSPADEARVLRGKLRAGRKLSSYLRYQAGLFEKAVVGDIKPSKAFSTIQLSWSNNRRFSTILERRPATPNSQGVNIIRENLRQVVSIAKTRPLSFLTRWPPAKLVKSVVGGLIAFPLAVSLAAAIWKQDGPEAITNDFYDRLGYSADRVTKSQIPKGKVLICEFKYSANIPDSPERQQYREAALKIAREKATGKDGLGSMAAEFERGVNVYIHTYYPGRAPEEGVQVAQEDGGCAASATQIEAFTP